MKEETKQCQNCKQSFVISSEDFSFYDRIKVPSPTWCSECRLVRRMSFRNERTLYKRQCQAVGHGEAMFSVFPPEAPSTVYCHSAWWGDGWDPMTYGRGYDFSRSFFEQMYELWKSVPDVGLFNINPVNSEYCSITEGNKNCYLVIGGDFNENSSYSSFIFHSRECVDCLLLSKCEWNYETVDCISCSQLRYARYCEGCYDSAFLFNCRNCHDCFGCTNLTNSSFCIFNEQYSKDDYKKKMNEIDMGSYAQVQKTQAEFETSTLKFPRRFAKIVKSVDVTGDFVEESKNCKSCFSVFGGAENSSYLWLIYSQVKDSYDMDHSGLSCLECCDSSTVYPGNKVFFSRFIFGSHDMEYSYNCHNSAYLFGCVGLRNKQYCIFNKQYTPEEFSSIRIKIIEHMNSSPYGDAKGRIYSYGEFFPVEFSPHAYNETVAQELRPLSKEEIEASGFRYKEGTDRNYTITKKWEELPDMIDRVGDDIVGAIISCQHDGTCKDQCTKAFKITQEELAFYRNFHVPLPRLCPNCRHYNRVRKKNPVKLWHRSCMCDKGSHDHEGKCSNEFETSYAPDRPEVIYCESCYQKEVL